MGAASWHTEGWILSRLCSSWLRVFLSVRELSYIGETSLREGLWFQLLLSFQASRWTTWPSTSSEKWSCVWCQIAGQSWTTLTTAATVVTEAPAPPWTIWTGQYSSAAIPDGATVQPESKVWCDDCQGAAKCTTSVTVMPCSIPSAGPSWTTPILNYTTTAAMRPTGRLPAAVSTSPPFYIRHLVWSNLSKSMMALTFLCSSFLGKNNECEMFICECDRKAAECFGRSHWNPEHEHLPTEYCQWKPQHPALQMDMDSYMRCVFAAALTV